MNNKSNRKNNAITPHAEWGLSNSFEDVFDEFKRSFDQLMTPFVPFFDQSPASVQTRAPFIDLIDEGEFYRINAELPGFTKDNVNVQITKSGMILHAERKSEKEDRGENYLRHERGYSSLQRRLDFPEEVNPDKVEGTLNNGVLELRIPKHEAKPGEKPKRVQLK